MVSLTNEHALEMAIEKALTGTCRENIKAGLTDISLPHHGFKSLLPTTKVEAKWKAENQPSAYDEE